MVALARAIAVTEDGPMVFRVEMVLGRRSPILIFGYLLGSTVCEAARWITLLQACVHECNIARQHRAVNSRL